MFTQTFLKVVFNKTNASVNKKKKYTLFFVIKPILIFIFDIKLIIKKTAKITRF